MNPRTVEDVLKDFRGRRAGIIKALTKDVEEFYKLCDPNNSNLCLYGFPNKQWEVNLPPPSDLPEPRLGINFVRDSLKKHEWLSMVALHSDAWLYAVASYFAAKFKFDKSDRKRLFSKIVDVPSICESMQGSVKKRVKAEGGGLPEELVEGILARLPVRDLLKYRFVCRMWRSLIDHPDFVSNHLANYKNNSESTNLLILYRPAKHEFTHEKVLVRRADTYRKVMDLESLVDHHRQISYVHVDGLLLIKKGISRDLCEIILWNPSINRSLNVPNSVFEAMRTATYVELGLGYDASCNDYKVIAIIYPQAEIQYGVRKRYRATMPGLVQVYKLSTNSWSTNLGVGIGVSPPPYWSVGKQVFINGAIHWINLGPNHVKDDTWLQTKDSYIVSFDVEKEDFNYFELPKGLISDAEPKEKFPTDFRGLFAIFCAYNDQDRNDIWVMGEYGVPDSWSKSYTFTLQFDKLLHFKSNGEVLFAVNWNGIKSYDVKREKVRDLAKFYSRNAWYTVYTYVERLVLFKKSN